MAEEVLYEQVETGDPDPLGLRKKAAAGKADPLGLRAKVSVQATPKEQQAAVQFRPMTDWLNIPGGGYQPMDAANAVALDDHSKNTAHAANRVNEHLQNIDPSISNLIYSHKKDLTGRIKSVELGINPREAGPINQQAAALESKLREEIQVKPEEIEEYKNEMPNKPIMLRRGLAQKVKDLTRADEAQANTLKGDIYRLDRQGSPEKEEVIAKNIEKLKTGEYDYDIVNGQLVKPEGFFSSIVTGFKEKGKAYDDYDVYKSGDEKKIMDRINQRLLQDPDKAVPVPKEGWITEPMAEGGRMLGGMPLKPLVAGGIAGYFSGGLASTAAAAAVSAPEMYKLTFGSALPYNYDALKKQNPTLPDSEVLQQAIDLTNKQANADALSGAAMGAIGARAALKPSTSLLLQKSVKSALKQIGETVAIEGLGGGAIGATGQWVKNIMAQKAGIPVDESEGMAQQLVGGAFMTLGMSLAAKAGNLLKPSTYNKLLHGLSKAPDEVIANELTKAQEVGAITAEEAYKVQLDINEQKKIDASIKPDVPEADRIKVQELIKKRNELEASLETEDKAYHVDTKEKIKKLNDQINGVSKGGERGELQKLVDNESKNIEGFVSETLRDATEKELDGYFKEISEQAHDPNSANQTVETFGEAIVNKAKELYPKKESTISVIQPGEIKQPETITIAPRERPTEVKSTEKVSVIMPKSEEGISAKVPDAPDAARVTPEEVAAIPIVEDPVPTQEGQPKEPEMQGITHAEMDRVSRELGLPEYSKDPETFEGWTREAKDRMAKDPDSINKLINKLRNGDLPDPVETQMMKMHFAALKDKYNKNPTPELLNEINRTKDLYNISGRQEGKRLVARKGLMPVDESSLADYHLRDVDFNKGAPLTEEQLAQSTKEFQEISAVKTALDEKVMKLEAENVKLKAQKEVEKIAKTAKKDGKRDYKAEREKVLSDMKKKWDDSRGQLSATFVPYADRLIKIAPDAARLVKLLVEEGIEKLPELVKVAHDHLKHFIPEITETDVHNLIAGEYNAKKPPRSKLSEQLYDLKKEAQLMNELDQLLSGVVPQNQKRQIRRNQRIEELRGQIKELKDEMGLNERTDVEKLASLKGRYKTKIKELEDKIAKGDYGPDEKPEPIKLDKDGTALRDEYLRLKDERAIRLLKQQYADRTTGEKLIAGVGKGLRTGRQIQSGFFDVSYPFRQTIVGVARQLLALPFKRENGKIIYTGFKSQRELRQQFGKMYQAFGSEKHYRRTMADIKEHPRFDVAKESKLDIAEIDTPLERFKEEEAQTSYAEKIPVAKQGVRMSNRAATVIANKMKFDIFNQLVDGFEQSGKTFENSPELYKEAAKYSNQLVGRGFLGEKLEMASPLIGHVLYSLRLQASRLQLLTNLINPRFYAKVPKEIRIEYFKDMTKFVLMGTAMLGLAKAAGLGVELDPRSSDFGSIRWGETRFDIWGGFKQYVTLFSRLLTASTKSPETGQISRLKIPFSAGTPEHREKTYGDLLLRFARTKASPEAGTLTDILVGETFDKKAVTARGESVGYIAPMIIGDVYDAWKDNGVLGAALTYILATHGVGAQSHIKEGDFDDLISGESESEDSGGASKKGKPTKKSKPSKNTK